MNARCWGIVEPTELERKNKVEQSGLAGKSGKSDSVGKAPGFVQGKLKFIGQAQI